jgi:phospholipase/carboxylesterase
MKIYRRDFCTLAATTITSLTVGGSCNSSGIGPLAKYGRFTARPHDGVKTKGSGQIMLGLDRDRDAILQLPKAPAESPLPLFIMMHGATQSAEDMFWYLGSSNEEAGVAVLAPNSRATTWDAIHNGFGEDVEFLNQALERVFESVAIDPNRIAIGGFSDGASYGISLGLINGDLFKSVVAFSPGFVIEGIADGKPRFFISHGTHDHILPIDRCGRRVADGLKARGYEVVFREFDGNHEVPIDVAREAMKWVANVR